MPEEARDEIREEGREADLVDRASRGDPIAVEALLEDQLPRLRAFIHIQAGRVLRAREESADIVQSVCRAVLSQKDRFRHGGTEEFRRWLYTIARHVVADKAKYWNRDRRDAAREQHPRLDDDDVASMSDVMQSLLTPSRIVSARERLERTQRAFDTLPVDYRTVISLARVLDLPHKEVAEQMGRSEVATRMLLHRALAALAAALEEA